MSLILGGVNLEKLVLGLGEGFRALSFFPTRILFFPREISFFKNLKKVIKNEDCFGNRVLFDISSNPSSLIVFSPHVAKRPVKWSVATTRAERSGAILTSHVGGRNNANAETISIFNKASIFFNANIFFNAKIFFFNASFAPAP